MAAKRKTAPVAQKAVTAAATPRRRLSPQQRRAQIVEAARTLFEQRPYPDISVEDVAALAGITDGLVYHYFDSRTGLFAAAIEAGCNELLAASIPDLSLPIPAQFEQGVRGYANYVEAHHVAYFNLFRGPAAQEPIYAAIIDRARGAIIEHTIAALGLADRPVPATRLAIRGYLGFAEATMLEWLAERPISRAALERMFFAQFLAALKSGLAAEARAPLGAKAFARLETEYRAHFRL